MKMNVASSAYAPFDNNFLQNTYYIFSSYSAMQMWKVAEENFFTLCTDIFLSCSLAHY